MTYRENPPRMPVSPQARGRTPVRPARSPHLVTPKPPAPRPVPPEERKEAGARGLVAPVVRMIVVQDESGQTVLVMELAPDAKFGVGVQAAAGTHG